MKTIKKSFVYIPLLVTVLLIIIGVMVMVAQQSNVIKINTSSDLIRFLQKDAGETDKRAVLYNDITMTDSFKPNVLACEFDGNGHTVDVKAGDVSSLFDSVSETGSVKNLVLIGKPGSTDNQVIAGICIRNLGTVENCVIKADFSGVGFVSGICHTNNGVITNCFVGPYEAGYENLRYIWNPICAENNGSVKGSYYSDASTGDYETTGTFISQEEMKSGNLISILNEYCEGDSRLIGWETDKDGYPCLESNDSNEAASVFSGGTAVFLVCIITLIIAVPIFTIVYVDKQKKKVIYKKG